jgi:hypothetical protein
MMDPDVRDRLSSAGFNIGGYIGRVAGNMTVTIWQSRTDSDLYVEIALPGGSRLGCNATRGAILGMENGGQR